MENKVCLPLLISVPHGGIEVPSEVKRYCRLDLPALIKDGDAWSGYLYNIKEWVLHFFHFPIARTIIDVNRAYDDRPPQNPDGVVKTLTANNDQVWADPDGLTGKQVELLLQRYYYHYHQNLSSFSESREIKLALDCHTMLERAPFRSDQPGEKRPLVCLSNRGDHNGEPIKESVTAPPDLIRALGHAFEDQLKNISRDKAVPIVQLNRPFSGGFITKNHGSMGKIPWIQVELNRSLYLVTEPRVAVPGRSTNQRINVLQECFIEALKMLSFK